jgi:predicted Rdx family selenoprotein
VSLQKAAEQKFGIKPRIKTGKNGDMTVFVDGKSVFGYKAEGQMPEINALLMRIEAART